MAITVIYIYVYIFFCFCVVFENHTTIRYYNFRPYNFNCLLRILSDFHHRHFFLNAAQFYFLMKLCGNVLLVSDLGPLKFPELRSSLYFTLCFCRSPRIIKQNRAWGIIHIMYIVTISKIRFHVKKGVGIYIEFFSRQNGIIV